MDQRVLSQAYCRLAALQSNLPDGLHADQRYIEEFHNILDTLEKESSTNLGAFRIPASEITDEPPRMRNTLTGEVYAHGPESVPPELSNDAN